MKRIEEKIGAVHAADEIEEISWWNEVVRELNEISVECARELQKESSAPQFLKPSGPQSYESMPPTRLLALSIPVVSWLGWVSHNKGGDSYNWKKIREAFDFGVNMSVAGMIP